MIISALIFTTIYLLIFGYFSYEGALLTLLKNAFTVKPVILSILPFKGEDNIKTASPCHTLHSENELILNYSVYCTLIVINTTKLSIESGIVKPFTVL